MTNKMRAILLVIFFLWGSQFLIYSTESYRTSGKQIFQLSTRTTCEIYRTTPNEIDHTLDVEMQRGYVRGRYCAIKENNSISYFRNQEIKMIVIKIEEAKKVTVILIKNLSSKNS